MLFQRLIWCALGIALLLGSVQSVFQQFQTLPLILAAEVFEEVKAEPVATPAAAVTVQHEHAAGAVPGHPHAAEPEHEHGGGEWAPAAGLERNGWTWVANVLHAFSMALLALVAMAIWVYRRGPVMDAAIGNTRLALAVAASGWLSLHFWPSLGLHAEVPGMEAAALDARQGWWLLAVACAAAACASVIFGRSAWRMALAAGLLALPFAVGAPQHTGDALAGFSGQAHAQMAELARQFVWATTWLSLSFWGLLGLTGAFAFRRWLLPVLAEHAHEPASAAA